MTAIKASIALAMALLIPLNYWSCVKQVSVILILWNIISHVGMTVLSNIQAEQVSRSPVTSKGLSLHQLSNKGSFLQVCINSLFEYAK